MNQLIIALLVAFCIFSSLQAFKINTPGTAIDKSYKKMRINTALNSAVPKKSYKDLMLEAIERKQSQQPPVSPSQARPTESDNIKQPWNKTQEKKTARDMAMLKNNIPFDEDIYEYIKGAIEMFTMRTQGGDDKKGLILTVEEAEWLKEAVEVIIEDAHKYGPPPRPVKVQSETQ